MHDIKTFTKTPLNKLKNLCIGDKIELLTYKKDRKITIIKKDLAIYNVIEDGFKYKEFDNVKFTELEHLLKQLQSVEFPRSNKYFFKISSSKYKYSVKNIRELFL